MSDSLAAAIAWFALGLHLLVGVAAWRVETHRRWLLWLNLSVGLSVLAYWIDRWIGYLTHQIVWYASDQAMPLYAVLVCVLSGLGLSRRVVPVAVHWLLFAIHVVILLGTVLFMAFFRMNRLF